MRPTRLPVLLAAAAVAGALSWLLAVAAYGSLPPLPRSVAVTMLLLAVLLAFTAVSTRNRLAGRPRTRAIPPLTVARNAALGKAGSLAGALIGGCWAGLLAYTLPRLDQRAAATDAVTCALGLTGSIAVVAAALWVERACRVRPPD